MTRDAEIRDSLYYWLALKRVEGIGNVYCKKLINAFRGPEAVFSASPEELQRVGGIAGATADRIRNFDGFDGVRDELARIREQRIDVVTLTDTRYPEMLKQIPDPPPFLYASGLPETPVQKCIAVVGTRFPSPYGERVTEDIVLELVRQGFTIVSGMAKGIDAVAHRTAVLHRGHTVAVWGTGIDRVYPAANAGLAQDIARHGLILTEYPTGTPPLETNFPERNRIISGMSLAVIVTEASLNSGTMITVSHALDQGREVFAVPGPIYSMMSQGTNRLIKQGGGMVDTIDSLVRELEAFAPPEPAKKAELPPEHADVLSALSSGPVDLDTLISRLKFDTAKVMSILTEMELSGIVKQLPGKRFVRME
ncbi:MAG: DNA-processing protein DprA [Deltaproteobacteria bacterium]|nr:DNA-processing protein DprA [Deltaproteobacteria bacterium]